MVTIQVQIDKAINDAADTLFSSFGFDTQTAIKMFLYKAIEYQGLPFDIRKPSSFSDDYIRKIMEFGKDPDPTFCVDPELHKTN